MELMPQTFEDRAKNQDPTIRLAIWHVLREVKKEHDVCLDDEVEYRISGIDKSPAPIDQRRAIKFLTKTEVLTVTYTHTNYFSPFATVQQLFENERYPYKYTMKVNPAKLNQFYAIYKAYSEDVMENKQTYFNPKDGTLTIKNKKITFGTSSASYYILKALFSTEDEYYNLGEMLDFQTLNELITSNGETEEIKDKSLRNAIKHINAQVFKKTKIKEDFLIVKTNTVQVNDKYLQ